MSVFGGPQRLFGAGRVAHVASLAVPTSKVTFSCRVVTNLAGPVCHGDTVQSLQNTHATLRGGKPASHKHRGWPGGCLGRQAGRGANQTQSQPGESGVRW